MQVAQVTFDDTDTKLFTLLGDRWHHDGSIPATDGQRYIIPFAGRRALIYDSARHVKYVDGGRVLDDQLEGDACFYKNAHFVINDKIARAYGKFDPDSAEYMLVCGYVGASDPQRVRDPYQMSSGQMAMDVLDDGKIVTRSRGDAVVFTDITLNLINLYGGDYNGDWFYDVHGVYAGAVWECAADNRIHCRDVRVATPNSPIVIGGAHFMIDRGGALTVCGKFVMPHGRLITIVDCRWPTTYYKVNRPDIEGRPYFHAVGACGAVE